MLTSSTFQGAANFKSLLEKFRILHATAFLPQGCKKSHAFILRLAAERIKLEGLIKEEPFLCYYSEDFYNEMKRLRALNLVQNQSGVTLLDIRRDYKDKGRKFDLKQFFFVTDHGGASI
jgi:hypothetical protein